MSTLQEIQCHALQLPELERAVLAAHLLKSLPPISSEEDEGIAEALRRDADMDSDPSLSVSLEEFKAAVIDSRKR